jgi:uncharacterized membrane protein
MSENYRVIFNGKIEPGIDLQQVIDRFSEKFKLERSVAEKVITAGRPVTLKKGLVLDKAEKYVAVLQRIGILVEIDPKPPEPEPEPEPETEPVPANTGLELEPLDHGGGDTTEVLEHVPGIDRCPKCGSSKMEFGICQDCGIVAVKYLAAQAALGEGGSSGAETQSGQTNPYSAPEAELEEPMENQMTGPVGVPAGNSLDWIGKGWWHFKSSPLAWIGALVVLVIISFLLAIIPVVNIISFVFIGPVIMGGFMYGCQEQDAGGDFTISHLFAGFSNNVGQLMLVALFYFIMMVVVLIVMMGGMFLLMGGIATLQDPEAMSMLGGGTIIGFMLMLFLLIIPVMMTYIFAPALVMLDDMSALQAMKYSFIGCLKNLLPLFIFGLLGQVLVFIGSIPFALGLFIVMPMLIAGVYAAYRDIFFS